MLNNKILALDIGGRSLKFKGYTWKGEVFRGEISISNFRKRELYELILEIFFRYGIMEKIGISQAGDIQNGEIKSCPRHPDLNGLNEKWFLENQICPKVRIINDADAVAFYGYETIKADSIVSLIVGTGLGCGAVHRGRIPSIGNLKNINNIPIEGTLLGKKCASIAIHTDEEKDWTLKNLDSEKVKTKIEKAARYFSRAVELVDKELKPEVILVSGGVSRFPRYFEIAQEETKRKINARLIKCDNPEFAGCDGALFYIQNEFQ